MQKQKSFYHPLFLVFLSFVLGVFAADCLAFSISWQSNSFFHILFLSLILLFVLYFSNIISRTYAYRTTFGMACLVLFFFMGFCRTNLENRINSRLHFSSVLQTDPNIEYVCKVKLREKAVEKKKSWKVEVDILAVNIKDVKGENIWLKTEGKAILYIQKDSTWKNPNYDQYLYIKAHFNNIENSSYSDFDYARFLFRKHVYHQAYVKSNNIIYSTENKDFSLYRKALALQCDLLGILQKIGLEGRELSLASALLLGQMEDMDTGLQQAYRSAGLIHILCVSGLHIGLFANVLMFLLGFLRNNQCLLIIKLCIICICIWSYAFTVGLSPSVMRAAVMFSFVSFGQCLNRESDIYRSLISSALLLLLINPYTLFSIGFQLSYLAVLGIVCFQKLFLQLWTPKYKGIRYIWELISVSISAQLMTAPLVIHYFHQFPNYFILSNLLGAPLSGLLLPLGMFLILFAHIHLPFAILIGHLFTWILRLLNTVVLYIEKLPSALLENIQISLLGSLILYALIFFIFGAIVKAKKKFIFASLFSLWLLIIIP